MRDSEGVKVRKRVRKTEGEKVVRKTEMRHNRHRQRERQIQR